MDAVKSEVPTHLVNHLFDFLILFDITLQVAKFFQIPTCHFMTIFFIEDWNAKINLNFFQKQVVMMTAWKGRARVKF